MEAAKPEYINQLLAKCSAEKIPKEECIGTLAWLTGCRMMHYASKCGSPRFGAKQRAQVLFFGMSLLLQFKLPEQSADLIKTHGFGLLYALLMQTGMGQPWKENAQYAGLFFNLVKTMFRGDHREITLGDVLASMKKVVFLT
jgi:hypothetical protein